MRFRVGPYVYTVQCVAGYIRHEGQDCLGLCDNERHVLFISDQASAAQQIQVACHEYMEAWVYHFGANLTDKEDYCDLFGLAMTQFVLDFIRELRPMLRDDVDLSGHVFMRDAAKLPAQGQVAGTPDVSPPVDVPPADRPAVTPYRVTRIYEPPPAGSAQPWQERVV